MAGDVLLVDDERLVARLYARAIEVAGYNVRLASDGVEAFDAIVESPPALVISDMQMPGMTGVALAQRLSARGLKPGPMILMSGDDGTGLVLSGLAAGFDDFLVKGASFDLLASRLHHWLGDGAPRQLPPHIRASAEEGFARALPHASPIASLHGPIDRLVDRTACLSAALLNRAPRGFGSTEAQRLRLIGVIDALAAALVRSNPLGQMRRPEVVARVGESLGDLNRLLRPLVARLDLVADDPTFRHAAASLSLTGAD